MAPGGGTATVTRAIGGAVSTHNVTSAVYDHTTGVTTLTADGYTPAINDTVVLADLAFICPSNSAYTRSPPGKSSTSAPSLD